MNNLVLVDIRENLAIVKINRPEVKNSLNKETIQKLLHVFQELSLNNSVKVIIFSATGNDAFCSGADLSELKAAKDVEQAEYFFRGLSDLIQCIHRAPQIIISCVNGYALAGGCGLAASADIVLATDDAVFSLPELQLGLIPMVVMPVIQRSIGRRALAELALTAERIDAKRALEIGLITRIVPKQQLEAESLRYASRISNLAPNALKVAKKLIYEIEDKNYFSLLNLLPKQIATISQEAEAQEGICSFLEKRKPSWL